MKTIYAIAAVLCAYLSVTDPSDTPTTATLDGIAATKAELSEDCFSLGYAKYNERDIFHKAHAQLCAIEQRARSRARD